MRVPGTHHRPLSDAPRPIRLADALADLAGGEALRVRADSTLSEAVSRLDAAADAPGLLVFGDNEDALLCAVPRRTIDTTIARILAAQGNPDCQLLELIDDWRDPVLRFDAGFPLGQAIAAAVARAPAMRYDPVLIESSDQGVTLVDLRVLLLRQCRALEESVRLAETERASAEQAAEARTRFLVDLGHEIRTPMTAIVGYADLLAGGRTSRPERDQHAHSIRRNADHLMQVVNDLLDASKLESGKMTIESAACDPLACIDDAISIVRQSAEAKGLAIGRTVTGLPPGCILSDPLRLRQILLNLLANAIKFTDRGGIDVELVDVPWPVPSLMIHVRDSGAGMTPEQCDGVFAEFQQADATISRRFGGSGLGLSISRRFAEMLGGTLTCSSLSGYGSTFSLHLRGIQTLTMTAQTGSADRSPAESRVPGSLTGLRILIAEDGIDNERLVCTHLMRAGAETLVVRDGASAVKSMPVSAQGAGRIDLILMDVEMPVMDGLQATRMLRSRGVRTPILATTAHDAESYGQKCREAGCDELLVKPVRPEALIETILRLVNLGRAGRENRAAA